MQVQDGEIQKDVIIASINGKVIIQSSREILLTVNYGL